MHPFVSEIALIFFCMALFFAAIYDLRFQRIPNWLNFSVVSLAILYYTFLYGLNGFIFSITGMLLGVALLIVPYMLGGMGAGDAKLMGAVGSVFGARGVFVVFLYSAIVGGIYAGIMLLIYRSQARIILKNIIYGINSLLYSKEWLSEKPISNEESFKLCYGLAIALGSFFYLGLEKMGISLFHKLPGNFLKF